jgi:hypothetical protein
MTDIEALELARIASMADGGCPVCVKQLTNELQRSFPSFEWKALAARFWNGEANHPEK